MTISFRFVEEPHLFMNFGEAFTGYKFFTMNVWRFNLFIATKPTRNAGGLNDGWFRGFGKVQ